MNLSKQTLYQKHTSLPAQNYQNLWTRGESNPCSYNANVLYYHYTTSPSILSMFIQAIGGADTYPRKLTLLLAIAR